MSSGINTDRLRIVFGVDSFALGGTEVNAAKTAAALVEDGHAVTVFALRAEGPLRAQYEALGIEIVPFPLPSFASRRAVAQFARAARELRRRHADVLHAHDHYSNVFFVPAARWAGVRCVVASRRWWRSTSRARGLLTRGSYRVATRVLANSDRVRDLVIQEDGVPAARVASVPNFVESALFEPPPSGEAAAMHARLGIPAGALVFTVVARLSAEKNHAGLLDALARMAAARRADAPPVHLLVAGDGPLQAALADQARALGMSQQVHLAGHLPRVPNPHAFGDVSVLPSLSEGFPNSVIEAMAAGRPVVATDVGGVLDAVDPGVTGLVVPPGDVAALADAMSVLADDPALRERLAAAGRVAAHTKFSRDAALARLYAVYRHAPVGDRPDTTATIERGFGTPRPERSASGLTVSR